MGRINQIPFRSFQTDTICRTPYSTLSSCTACPQHSRPPTNLFPQKYSPPPSTLAEPTRMDRSDLYLNHHQTVPVPKDNFDRVFTANSPSTRSSSMFRTPGKSVDVFTGFGPVIKTRPGVVNLLIEVQFVSFGFVQAISKSASGDAPPVL